LGLPVGSCFFLFAGHSRGESPRLPIAGGPCVSLVRYRRRLSALFRLFATSAAFASTVPLSRFMVSYSPRCFFCFRSALRISRILQLFSLLTAQRALSSFYLSFLAVDFAYYRLLRFPLCRFVLWVFRVSVAGVLLLDSSWCSNFPIPNLQVLSCESAPLAVRSIMYSTGAFSPRATASVVAERAVDRCNCRSSISFVVLYSSCPVAPVAPVSFPYAFLLSIVISLALVTAMSWQPSAELPREFFAVNVRLWRTKGGRAHSHASLSIAPISRPSRGFPRPSHSLPREFVFTRFWIHAPSRLLLVIFFIIAELLKTQALELLCSASITLGGCCRPAVLGPGSCPRIGMVISAGVAQPSTCSTAHDRRSVRGAVISLRRVDARPMVSHNRRLVPGGRSVRQCPRDLVACVAEPREVGRAVEAYGRGSTLFRLVDRCRFDLGQ